MPIAAATMNARTMYTAASGDEAHAPRLLRTDLDERERRGGDEVRRALHIGEGEGLLRRERLVDLRGDGLGVLAGGEVELAAGVHHADADIHGSCLSSRCAPRSGLAIHSIRGPRRGRSRTLRANGAEPGRKCRRLSVALSAWTSRRGIPNSRRCSICRRGTAE